VSEEYASDMQQFSTAKPENVKRFRDLSQSVIFSVRNIHPSKMLFFWICVSLVINLVRPQNLPGLGIIGTVRLPIMVTFVTALFWLPYYRKNVNWPMKLILILLLIQAVRGLLGQFADPNDVIVRNNNIHFFTFRNLALQMIGLHLPIVACLACKKGLHQVTTILVWIATFLAIWGLTHAGKGPGGFVNDENDLCYVLLSFLPLAVLHMATADKAIVRLCHLAAIVFIIGGVVSTVSRGGMLGFGALAVFLFLRSDKKPLFLLVAIVGAVVALPILPDKFKDELFSIQTEVGANTGTVQKRTQLWNVTLRVFKDPRHTGFGVGMNNLSRWMHEYDFEAMQGRAKSKWGRAVHSVYFQILGDLGAAGVILIGLALLWVVRSNMKIEKRFKKVLRALKRLGDSESEILVRDYGANNLEVRNLIRVFQSESFYITKLAVALNATLVGGMAAAVAISVLYYPIIWLLISLSVAFSFYAQQVLGQVVEFYDLLEGKGQAEYK